MVEIRKKAKEFCLASANKEQVCLEDYSGKFVVLFFYVKDNTSGWTAEALEFSELKSEFEELNAEILGVSPDSVASHQKFIQKHKLSIDLLSDPDHKVLKAYQVWGKKKMYGKEYEGVIRSTVVIDSDGLVRLAWPKAKAKGHALEVLTEMRKITGW